MYVYVCVACMYMHVYMYVRKCVQLGVFALSWTSLYVGEQSTSPQFAHVHAVDSWLSVPSQ